PGILFTIIVSAVYPVLAATAPKDRAWFRSAITNTARLAILVSVPVAAGLALVATDLVDLFGDGDFDGAALLVVILAGHIPLAAIGTVIGAGLWSLDRQRTWAMVAWVAVALNVVGNFAAIPLTAAMFDDGAIGACAVTLATEVFMTAA